MKTFHDYLAEKAECEASEKKEAKLLDGLKKKTDIMLKRDAAVHKKLGEEVEVTNENLAAKKKRGRPSASAHDEEESGAEPILVQLRKHELARGQRKIQFDNGEYVDVSPTHVKKALDMHVHQRTSLEKGEFQKKLAHSHASFKSAIGIKEEVEQVEENHWIQAAIKHPGKLHRELGVLDGYKIPTSTLNAAAKRDDKLGQRARLAIILKNFHKKDK